MRGISHTLLDGVSGPMFLIMTKKQITVKEFQQIPENTIRNKTIYSDDRLTPDDLCGFKRMLRPAQLLATSENTMRNNGRLAGFKGGAGRGGEGRKAHSDYTH